MDTTLAVVTATIVGLMVGVELAVAVVMNPILLRLPAGPSIEAQADGGRVLGRAMPPWYIASLVLTAALTAVTWGSAAAQASAIAVVLQVLNVVMSLTILVPINNRSKTWTADEHPTDWREQHRRWNRWNYVRVVLVGAAFVLVLLAVAAL